MISSDHQSVRLPVKGDMALGMALRLLHPPSGHPRDLVSLGDFPVQIRPAIELLQQFVQLDVGSDEGFRHASGVEQLFHVPVPSAVKGFVPPDPGAVSLVADEAEISVFPEIIEQASMVDRSEEHTSELQS